MNNLYSVGCSHTKYVWPTYADILGQEFDNHYNWGQTGIGNFAIMNRALEIADEMTEDDTLIIQWTYPARFDFHISKEGWYRGGNLANNHDMVQDTIDKYAFDADTYELLTNNYIKLTKTYLDANHIDYRMIGSDYDVGDLPALSIAKEFDIAYYKFLNVRPNVKMIKKQVDHHYTPRHHLEYLYQTDFTITKKMLHYIEQAEKIIEDIHDWKWLQFRLEDAGLTQRVTYGR